MVEFSIRFREFMKKAEEFCKLHTQLSTSLKLETQQALAESIILKVISSCEHRQRGTGQALMTIVTL